MSRVGYSGLRRRRTGLSPGVRPTNRAGHRSSRNRRASYPPSSYLLTTRRRNPNRGFRLGGVQPLVGAVDFDRSIPDRVDATLRGDPSCCVQKDLDLGSLMAPEVWLLGPIPRQPATAAACGARLAALPGRDAWAPEEHRRARCARRLADQPACDCVLPRARGAPVSMPIDWRELKAEPDKKTLLTVPKGLRRLRTDPWAD